MRAPWWASWVRSLGKGLGYQGGGLTRKRASVTDMATRIMLPCKGFSPAWEWMSVWQLEALQGWWGNSARLVRESVGAPGWAKYVDRDGNAWTRDGLLTRMLLDAIDLHGEAHVEAILNRLGPERARDMLDGWIAGRVFMGELVRLVGEGEA